MKNILFLIWIVSLSGNSMAGVTEITHYKVTSSKAHEGTVEAAAGGSNGSIHLQCSSDNGELDVRTCFSEDINSNSFRSCISHKVIPLTKDDCEKVRAHLLTATQETPVTLTVSGNDVSIEQSF